MARDKTLEPISDPFLKYFLRDMLHIIFFNQFCELICGSHKFNDNFIYSQSISK